MHRTRFDTETGRRITRMLVEARSTQRRLARLLGVPYSTLNQMITGRMPPWPGLERDARRALGLVLDPDRGLTADAGKACPRT